MSDRQARFRVGQLIHHKRFDYRGVIVDVDPVFSGTEEWYAVMATSRPPKDQPWYHVPVDDAVHRTYVAERNLEPDLTRELERMVGQQLESLAATLPGVARAVLGSVARTLLQDPPCDVLAVRGW